MNKTYMMDSFILLTDSDKLKYKRIFAFNIEWDLDDEDKEVVLPDSELFFLEKDSVLEDDEIGDKLSNKYGFCYKGFGFIEA